MRQAFAKSLQLGLEHSIVTSRDIDRALPGPASARKDVSNGDKTGEAGREQQYGHAPARLREGGKNRAFKNCYYRSIADLSNASGFILLCEARDHLLLQTNIAL